ncbi:MAG: MmcQ/YjbR family DNA-binding protein [Saprospiraceae bacterium]|nr:MmcQ/YjbR family DNA-binding protein [Saprospiraceae bacterium]
MTLEEIRKYCLSKPHVTEDMPFGEDILVFRVGGKMFLLTNLTAEVTSMNLKCDPLKAIELRDRHESITPGYHMNKKHWNTVLCDDTLTKSLQVDLIDHSYDLVFRSLSRKQRDELQ